VQSDSLFLIDKITSFKSFYRRNSKNVDLSFLTHATGRHSLETSFELAEIKSARLCPSRDLLGMAIRWTAAESSFARSTRLTMPANRHGNAIGHASGSMRYSIVEYCTPAASSYKLLRALDSAGYRGGSFRRLLPWSTT